MAEVSALGGCKEWIGLMANWLTFNSFAWAGNSCSGDNSFGGDVFGSFITSAIGTDCSVIGLGDRLRMIGVRQRGAVVAAK